jgi:hypothetical protein
MVLAVGVWEGAKILSRFVEALVKAGFEGRTRQF